MVGEVSMVGWILFVCGFAVSIVLRRSLAANYVQNSSAGSYPHSKIHLLAPIVSGVLMLAMITLIPVRW